ncbi:MAG: 2-C-methyl-D-erythritol 4-phosphate cytidylyltransferase [Betaproteobacteria bacterium]|nr:2-C-methyl-D-erythritol 4-phosphate cytidylyltransferase [Betaproteobacteria bacterium]
MPRYMALIPAAGSGSRMGAATPKQYAQLAGKPLIQHAVQRLCAHPQIAEVFVVLAPGDKRFGTCDWSVCGDKLTALFCGGETRAATVYNGLLAANDAIDGADWVLVHDAARPCLQSTDIDRLIAEVGDDDVGGLLAVPVADTLKRANAVGEVMQTEARENLWRAQTPQMFRYRVLLEALRRADIAAVTDEASAVEQTGARPRLVRGSSGNLKVTYPEDMALAELILKAAG